MECEDGKRRQKPGGTSICSPSLQTGKNRRRRPGNRNRNRNRNKPSVDYYGDILTGDKPENVFRIACANMNTCPASHKHWKNQDMADYITKFQFDTVGLGELNRYWKNMAHEDQFRRRFSGQWEHMHTRCAYNKQDTLTKGDSQVGGTALISIDQAAHRAVGSGIDASGLGRWVWTRFAGQGGKHLRVVQSYRPCRSTGPNTVYAQHQRYFDSIVKTPAELVYLNRHGTLKKTDDAETAVLHTRGLIPTSRFLYDLKADIKAWQEEGDILIVMGDFNADIRGDLLRVFFGDLSMREIITSKHDPTKAPATFHAGSVPIDGIWASLHIEPLNCGYTPFVNGFGDHRLPWADLSYANAFGHVLPLIERPIARRLRLHDPRIVAKYNSLRLEHAAKQQLGTYISIVNRHAVYPSRVLTDHAFEIFDEAAIKGILYADKHCRKIRRGALPWSPQLQYAKLQTFLIESLIKRRQGKKVSSRMIRRTQVKLGDNTFHRMKLLPLQREYLRACARYRAVKANAAEHRQHFLRDLAYARAEAFNTKAESEIKSMEGREEQRRVAEKLRTVSGKPRKVTLTQLTREITLPNGTKIIEEALDPDSLGQFCADDFEYRLHLTETSPCMMNPLLDDLGYLGITDESKELLNGLYSPPIGINDHTRSYLEELSWVNQAAINTPQDMFTKYSITTEEHIAGWKWAKERTAPGYSGITTAHWKAACLDPTLAAIDAAWANYPYVTGYSPKRWRNGVDLMIPKKTNNTRVENLRPIVLFEVDCNQNHKRLGRQVMRLAEAQGGIAREQYGSRKGHMPAEQSLNKRLTFDLLRCERRSAVDSAVDLRSNYDLVAHATASISLQRQGLPEPPIVCMFTTLQNMEHYIRTAYGISDATFGGDGLWAFPYDHPPQGLNQGNGAGPAIWAVVSTPVLNMLRSKGYGAAFKLALSGGTLQLVGYAFVDDSDIIQTAESWDSPMTNVCEKAQEALDLFVGGMNATGGQIRPDKCHCHKIAFEYKKRKWTYVKAHPDTPDLYVQETLSKRTPIKELGPSTAAETLGIWLAPDGNNKTAVEVMTLTSRQWADRVRAGFLTPNEAWTSFSTTISKKLEYPLLALALTKKECHAIERPMVKQLLASSRVSNSFPRAVFNGPMSLNGLGRTGVYHNQGGQHVEALIRHGPSPSVTGDLLRALIERHNLELGLQTSILRANYRIFHKLATKTWIKNTWEYIHAHDMVVEDDVPTLQLQRVNDQFLMQAFSDHGFTGTDLARLNETRMFLQVITLADISSGDGRHILIPSCAGVLNTLHPSESIQWPRSAKPTQEDKRRWSQAVRAVFTRNPSSTSRRLRDPLGAWLAPLRDQIWSYSPSSQQVFKKQQNGWQIYRATSMRPSRHQACRLFRPTQRTQSIPCDAMPTRVYSDRQGIDIRSTGIPAQPIIPQATLDPTTLPGHLGMARRVASVRLSQRWATRSVEFHDNGKNVVQAIRKGIAKAVSDGSYLKGSGAAGFILIGSKRKHQLKGSLVLPGSCATMSAYRSELGGLYGIVCLTEQLCLEHKVTKGKITIGCDGKEALWQALGNLRPISPRASDFDLVTAIRKKVSRLPITVDMRWIKGHQDSCPGSFATLDLWARLNVEMDLLAKQRRAVHDFSPDPADAGQAIADEPWRLFLQGIKVTKRMNTCILEHCAGFDLREYWHTHQVDQSLHSSVYWEAVGMAQRSLPWSRRCSKLKRVTGMLGVGKFMQRWNQQSHSKCPRCGDSPEDMEHVLTCPKADAHWNAAWSTFCNWAGKNPSSPGVFDSIKVHLDHWRNSLPPPYIGCYEGPLYSALKSQSAIGWQNLLDGFIATEWEVVQAEFYDATASRRSPLRWAAGLIRNLGEISASMWAHRNLSQHAVSEATALTLEDAVDYSITTHFARSQASLNRTLTNHLFRGGLKRILDSSFATKIQWIASLVSARERAWRLANRVGAAATMLHERSLLLRWRQLGHRFSARPRTTIP